MTGLSSIPIKELNRTRIERELIARAFKQKDFRQKLVDNPKSVLSKELGVSIPKEIEILVHEETPKNIHLVIPVDTRKVKGSARGTNTRLKALVWSRGEAFQKLSGKLSNPRKMNQMDWTRVHVNTYLTVKALKSASFKNGLVADPRSVLKKELGLTIPREYNLAVHEESANTIHLVIPNNPDVPDKVRNDPKDERLKAVIWGCPDQCFTYPQTSCGTCSLVTYCTQPPC